MAAALHAAHVNLLNSQRTLPTLARICVGAAVAVTVWNMRHTTRRTLAGLDPVALRDIGLTSGQARSEAGKPFYRR